MTRENIAIGTTANDGTGDTLRSSGIKINNNFVQLFKLLGGDSDVISAGISFTNDSIVFEGSSIDGFETSLGVVNPTADRSITLPDATGNIVLDITTQTLTNKTLTTPVFSTPKINDTSADHTYNFAVSELTANRTITLPLLTAADTFVFQNHTQTLTNKTLTAPALSAPSIATQINDVNGAEITTIGATASAINHFAISNAAIGLGPTLASTGDDTNVDLNISTKGTGSIKLSKVAYNMTTVTANGVTPITSSFIDCNKGTALALSLANGTVPGESKKYANRGAGVTTVTPTSFANGTSFAIAQNEACEVIWNGISWFLVSNQSIVTIA